MHGNLNNSSDKKEKDRGLQADHPIQGSLQRWSSASSAFGLVTKGSLVTQSFLTCSIAQAI